MLDNHDEFMRITKIISLIRYYDIDDTLPEDREGITIKELAGKTGCTLRQMRSDIAALSALGIHFMNDSVDISSLSEKTAEYDNEPLFLDDLFADRTENDELLSDEEDYDSCFLFLTSTAAELYRTHSLGDVFIKNSPLSIPEIEKRHAEVIQSAIDNGWKISFRYKNTRDPKAQNISIFPRFLYHDLTNQHLYCLDIDTNDQIIPYRLDRICFLVHPDKTVCHRQESPDKAVMERIQRVWGADFANDDEPVHVKVKVRASTNNLLAKFDADTKGRGCRTFTPNGRENGYDVYLYEDEVIGINSFRSWLRRYGSSVKVLEPASLAEAMKKTAERSIINYESGQFAED